MSHLDFAILQAMSKSVDRSKACPSSVWWSEGLADLQADCAAFCEQHLGKSQHNSFLWSQGGLSVSKLYQSIRLHHMLAPTQALLLHDTHTTVYTTSCSLCHSQLCLQIEGVENLPPASQPAVYVSNHQSFLV